MTILAFPAGIGEHSSRATNSVGPTCDNAYDAPPAISVSTTFAEYGATTAMSREVQTYFGVTRNLVLSKPATPSINSTFSSLIESGCGSKWQIVPNARPSSPTSGTPQ